MEKLIRRSEQKMEDCWDLTPLVKDEQDYEEKKAKVQNLSQAIVAMKGHILDSKENLKKFLELSEQEERIADILYIYVRLNYDEDTANSQAVSKRLEIEQLLNRLADDESFITSEFMKRDLKDLQPWLDEDETLHEYQLYFERLYRQKKRILSEQEEKIITKAMNAFGTPDDAFTSLDTTDATFGNVLLDDGTKVPLTQYNWPLFLENPSGSVRRRAFQTFYRFYEMHKNTFASLLKGNYQELEFIRDIRKYDSALEMALDESFIDKKVYTNLIHNVHQYMDLNVDYQKWKAKELGNSSYHLYDTYVPVVKLPEKKYTKEEAISLVLEALKPLKEDYLEHFKKILDSHSVDFYPNEFKHTGAYHWGCYDSPNYVLLNFNGSVDDVSTLAHETGHAVHSLYSKENNSFIYHSYGIFLAEIASTVNETLLSFYLLNHAQNNEEKKFYLCEFLDKVKATIYRQTMFAEFESMMSEKAQKKEPLTEEVISSTYYDLNKEYFKDSVIVDPEIRYEWMRISHFYSPFYVYKYATGLISAICIVKDIMDGKEGFVSKYLQFLKSGCSKNPLDILQLVDIDLTSDAPFQKAFTFIKECLEQLKNLEKEGESLE